MSTKKKILLSGGRAPATLELARLLASQGHSIFVMESVPTFVCHYSRFVEKCLFVPSPRTDPYKFHEASAQHIQKEKIDIFIPTCEEIFTLAENQKRLSSLCQCWFESISSLHSLHNKWTFLQKASGLAARLPHTIYLTSWNEVEITLAHYPENDWILKPVYSRFSIDMQDLSNGERPYPVHISSNRPWILQEKITGMQICTYSLAYKGRLLLHSAYTTPYTAGKGGGIAFSPYEDTHLQHTISQWIKKEHWTGQLSFDWIKNEAGEIIPIECNPRLTSGIHLFSNEDRIDRAFTSPEKVNQTILPQLPQKKMITLAMLLYGLRSCKNMKHFTSWCKVMHTYHDVVFHWKDPLPLFSQLKSLWYFWKTSQYKQISLLQASTEDIEWNGE